MGYRSSWDTQVHGIQHFMGYISSWDTEIHLREIRKFLGCMPLENTEAQRIEGTVDAGVFGIHTVGIDMMFFETRLQIVRAIFNVSLAWLNPRQDHKTPSHHLAFIFVNHHNLHGGKKFSLVNPLHV
jgi:hypothetical protein